MWKLLLLMIVTFSSCTKHEEDVASSDKDNKVEVTLSYHDAERVDVRGSISDINLYFYNKKIKTIQHFYVNSSIVKIDLLRGDYTIYAVGGLNRNAGVKTLSEVENMSAAFSSELLIINKASQLYTLKIDKTIDTPDLSLLLKRVTSKLDFKISVKAGFNFEPEYLKLFNCGTTVSYFKPTRGLKSENTEFAGRSIRADPTALQQFLVLENMWGSVPSVTGQKNKSKDTAPDGAMYVEISGTIDQVTKAIYRIYLGRNNTSNFDVERNTHIVNNIKISGVNKADHRVEFISTDIASFAPRYIRKQTASARVYIDAHNDAGRYVEMKYVPIGTTRASVSAPVKFGNTTLRPNIFARVGGGNTEIIDNLTYKQNDKGKFSMTVTIRDNKGYTSSKDLNTEFIALTYPITVSSSGDGKDIVTTPTSGEFDEDLPISLGCTFDKASSEFKGWYENGNLLSNNSSFSPLVTQATSYNARVELKNFNVTVKGGIGTGVYKWGTNANISYYFEQDQIFYGWHSSPNIGYVTSNNFNYIVNENIVFTADYLRVKVNRISDGSQYGQKYIFTAEGRNGVRIEVKYEYYESSAAHPGRPPERYEDSFIMNSNESHTTGAYSRETFDVTVLSVKEI